MRARCQLQALRDFVWIREVVRRYLIEVGSREQSKDKYT